MKKDNTYGGRERRVNWGMGGGGGVGVGVVVVREEW